MSDPFDPGEPNVTRLHRVVRDGNKPRPRAAIVNHVVGEIERSHARDLRSGCDRLDAVEEGST